MLLLLCEAVILYPCLRVYGGQIHVDLTFRVLEFLPEYTHTHVNLACIHVSIYMHIGTLGMHVCQYMYTHPCRLGVHIRNYISRTVFFSSSSGVGFHTRLLCLYHVCGPNLHVCVYMFTHIHTTFTGATCMCVCACLHVHTLIYTCVCTCVHIYVCQWVCV